MAEYEEVRDYIKKLNDPTAPTGHYIQRGVLPLDIPKYFTELKDNLALKYLCRAATRKHQIDLDRHENLFRRIPQLALPWHVTDYMLYFCTLESDGEDLQ